MSDRKPAGARLAAWRRGAVLLVLAVLAGCAQLPSLAHRTESTALHDTDATALGQAASVQAQAHPGLSGVYPLRAAGDAFAARMLLARAAEKSLDIQYYIWHRDLTGTLLFDAVRAAADRGVRVRLLLDDNNTSGLDPTLAALDAHPNIEVRLFNPFVLRSPRWIGFLTDFSRLNRRMHNKSFTADNQATIIGGRNVGDEYFGAGDGMLFSDLDVLAIGQAVGDVSDDFDRYWSCASSYPVDRLLLPAEPAALDDLSRAAAGAKDDAEGAAYLDTLRHSAFVDRMLHRELEFEWAPTRMISDEPEKGEGHVDRDARMIEKLKTVIGAAHSDVDIVSAYFVPGARGTEALARLAEGGVKVRVLTNALEATDVPAVHAGYAKRRPALLEHGVTLYELARHPDDAAARRAARFHGSSTASLHAKTFAVDRTHLFIGSFNFDPRSIELNTELGFLIDSPALAGQVATGFDTVVPERAYRVQLTPAGDLEWTQQHGGAATTMHTEPGTSVWLRMWVRLLSVLPIDWLL